jgi:aspartate/methionine/tyrosine aminotransferase
MSTTHLRLKLKSPSELTNPLLADAAYRIEGQPMFKILGRIEKLEQQGEDIIHFEMGDSDFNTPLHIIEAAYTSMKNGETHYTNSMGLHDLRETVREANMVTRGFKPDISQVLITPGAGIVIYCAVQCLVNPGEEVIVPDPGFSTYYSVLKFCQAVPVRVPLKEKNRFRINPDDIRKVITPRTRLIIINSPNNPTGSIITRDEIDELYSIAEENGIFLLSDEVYSEIIYGNVKFHSPSSNDHCRRNTIVVDSFSKNYAMTGWRLGTVIGPPEVIEKMGLLIQTICSCVPPFTQRAGITALTGDQTEVRRMVAAFKKRRDLLVEGLNSIPGVNCLYNDGAIYVFPNITGTGMTSKEFTDFILEKAKVVILPGTDFGRYGEGYVRLTHATSIDNILEGVRRMKKAVENR